MKTKYGFKHFLGGVLVATFMLAQACSDGVLPVENPPVNPAVSPVGSFSASQGTVDQGGSVTLSWEVSPATKVEITSNDTDNKFSYSTDKDFKSSTTVENLKKTTIFTLTATNCATGTEVVTPASMTLGKQTAPTAPTTPSTPTAPATPTTPTTPATPETPEAGTPAATPDCVQSFFEATVTVKQNSTLSIESFNSDAPKVADTEDKYQLATGDTDSVLSWTVLPEDATVTITASTGDKDLPVKVDCVSETGAPTTTSKAEQETGIVTDAFPSKGCATVHPTEETTYTLTATVGDQAPITKTITISVNVAPTATLTVNDGPDAKVASFPAQVTLVWAVTPAKAKVTITATPVLKEDAAKLPTNSDQVSGTITVQVNENTEFKLVATVEGQTPAADTATVSTTTVATLDCAKYKASVASQAPVFAGETVGIRWAVQTGAPVTKVQVAESGTAVSEAAYSVGNINFPAKKGGYSVSFVDASGKSFCQQAVNIPLASLLSRNSYKAVRLVKDPKDPTGVYVGIDGGGYNKGHIKVAHYNPKESVTDIDFLAALKAFDPFTAFLGDMNSSFLPDLVKTYPVNAIAVNPSTGDVYVATTGSIVYQTKEGWKTLTTLLRSDDHKNYSGNHPSCFGKSQTGRKYHGQGAGELVTMGQVCDMLATADGALYAATDRGLLYLKDVKKYIKSHKSEPVQGRSKSNPLYPSVVNTVSSVNIGGKDVILAGGARGVFTSADGGASWNKIGSDMGEVYSLAVGPTSISSSGAQWETIVAGTAKGIYVMNANGQWSQVDIGAAAYSVSVDPYDPSTIYAGTAKGLYVSRDAGATFADVTPAGDKPVVRSVLPIYSADPRTADAEYYIYLATETGVMSAYVSALRFEVPVAAYSPELPPVDATPPTGDTPSTTPTVEGGTTTPAPEETTLPAIGWGNATGDVAQ